MTTCKQLNPSWVATAASLAVVVLSFGRLHAEEPPRRIELIPPKDANVQPATPEPKPATDDELFQKLDTNRDGVLSGTEIKGIEPYDLNRDGIVTLQEFKGGMAIARGSQRDEKVFEWMGGQDGKLSGAPLLGIASYDTQRRGFITKEEFLLHRAMVRKRAYMANPSTEDQARLRFWQLDANGDGRLSGTEMKDYKHYDTKNAERLYEDDFVAAYVKEHDGGAKPQPVNPQPINPQPVDPQPFVPPPPPADGR